MLWAICWSTVEHFNSKKMSYKRDKKNDGKSNYVMVHVQHLLSAISLVHYGLFTNAGAHIFQNSRAIVKIQVPEG